MKSVYAGVTHWVRFNARMAQYELQLCNSGCIEPWVGLFLGDGGPDPAVSDYFLSVIEELSGIVWLLEREHTALLERSHEMFAPRGAIALPTEISELFRIDPRPYANLLTLREVVAARAVLIETHGGEVDAHTRLVFRKHLNVLRHLIIPALDQVAALVESETMTPAISRDALIGRYRSFLPGHSRPHPDSFLSVGLLKPAKV